MSESGSGLQLELRGSEIPFPAEQLLQRSRNLLERYYPAALPQEPTFLFIHEPNSVMPDSDPGGYYGQFNGTHFIEMVSPDAIEGKNGLKREPTLAELIANVHELVHQRHNEVAGSEAYSGWEELPTFISTITEKTPWEIAFYLQGVVINATQDAINNNRDTIADAVKEGVATFVELTVLDELAKDINRPFGISLEEIEKEKQDRMSMLESIRETPDRKLQRFNTHAYPDGYTIVVEKLAQNMKGNTFSEVIGRVNLKACNNIPSGSQTYKSMIENPTLIPGLSII